MCLFLPLMFLGRPTALNLSITRSPPVPITCFPSICPAAPHFPLPTRAVLSLSKDVTTHSCSPLEEPYPQCTWWSDLHDRQWCISQREGSACECTQIEKPIKGARRTVMLVWIIHSWSIGQINASGQGKTQARAPVIYPECDISVSPKSCMLKSSATALWDNSI